jgi:hypothetical protein
MPRSIISIRSRESFVIHIFPGTIVFCCRMPHSIVSIRSRELQPLLSTQPDGLPPAVPPTPHTSRASSMPPPTHQHLNNHNDTTPVAAFTPSLFLGNPLMEQSTQPLHHNLLFPPHNLTSRPSASHTSTSLSMLPTGRSPPPSSNHSSPAPSAKM